MRMLERDEYAGLTSFLKKKTSALWEHERLEQEKQGKAPKNYYQGIFHKNDCRVHIFNDTTIVYRVYNVRFIPIICELTGHYLRAIEKFPEMFGSGNAKDVIQALYDVSGYHRTLEDYIEYLQTESCCYIVQKQKNTFSDEILRIDLFREYMQNKYDENKCDFVGGLFHSLKHFSKDRKNLSIGSDINDVFDIEHIVWLCICAFLQKNPCDTCGKVWNSYLPLNNGYKLKFVFFHEVHTNTFFIKTIHKQAINS